MKIRRVALIIFYDKYRRILLQKRGSHSKIGENWGFFGGGIKEGETPEEAIKREVREELGFDLKEFKFIGEFKNRITGELVIDRFVFISPLPDKLSKFNLSEGEDMQLFSLDEAEKLKMVPGDELVIRKLKEVL